MTKNRYSRESNLIIAFFAILILVVSYQFGYMTFKDKANEINTENAANMEMLEELNNRTDNEGNYLEEIKNMKTEIDEISHKYDASLTQERILLFVMELEEHADMTVDTVTFEDIVNLTSTNKAPPEETMEETLDELIEFDSEREEPSSWRKDYVTRDELSLYSLGINISYKSDYDGLKKAIDYMNKYDSKVNIRSFTTAFDDTTGYLTGSMIIDFYMLPEYGREYIAPMINVPLGVDDIFGTIEPPEILEEDIN
ncbi:MAG TPA: hypothetical protein GXZ21_06790 [Clostridiales bacterium]|nr:hypothetical protein [Clostridiales bacterium]